jgi:ribosomal-protein-alanine N-acetyltransferase
VKIRTATAEDIEGIISLESECMPHPWSRQDIEALVTDERKFALIAEDDGRLAGYIGISYVLDEAEVGNICVSGSYRRRGIACSLINEIKELLYERGVIIIFLEVESDNSGAISLYEKCGFIRYSVRENYYGPGRDALLYRFDRN